MKTLAFFILIVLFGTTSLIKWFEAPRDQLVGEPFTVIAIAPLDEQTAPVVENALFPAVSVGSIKMERDDSGPEPTEVPANQAKTESDDVTPAPADTAPQPVKVSKTTEPEDSLRNDQEPASPVVPDDVASPSTSPAGSDTSVAVIPNDTAPLPQEEDVSRKPFYEPQSAKHSLTEITPGSEQLPTTAIPLPPRAPDIPPAAEDSLQSPVDYDSLGTQSSVPTSTPVIEDEKIIRNLRRQARLRERAKRRVEERARRRAEERAQKWAQKKAQKLKAQQAKQKAENDWASKILNND